MNKALPTDHMGIRPSVKQMTDGPLCIRFEGGMLRTQPGNIFGLMLARGTTRQEAEALAAQLEIHCPYLFVTSVDHERITEGRTGRLGANVRQDGVDQARVGEQNEDDDATRFWP